MDTHAPASGNAASHRYNRAAREHDTVWTGALRADALINAMTQADDPDARVGEQMADHRPLILYRIALVVAQGACVFLPVSAGPKSIDRPR
jgi:ferric-dicitrate binding protein FerR (iron transport regulator)